MVENGKTRGSLTHTMATSFCKESCLKFLCMSTKLTTYLFPLLLYFPIETVPPRMPVCPLLSLKQCAALKIRDELRMEPVQVRKVLSMKEMLREARCRKTDLRATCPPEILETPNFEASDSCTLKLFYNKRSIISSPFIDRRLSNLMRSFLSQEWSVVAASEDTIMFSTRQIAIT